VEVRPAKTTVRCEPKKIITAVSCAVDHMPDLRLSVR